MAESPRYQRANVIYADMPNIQPTGLQEELASSRRISSALDQMIGITTDIGKKYAMEAAGKYSIENPVTKEQLLEAQKTNANPIAKDLKGGTIFNDTLKKVYAQQASSEFTQIAYTHFEDVLKQVENGTLSDPESIRQSLDAIIKPQSQVLSNIDVETGVGYDAKATAYANTYFKQANKELERQARERIDLLSNDTLTSHIKMFDRDTTNEMDPVILKEKLALHLDDAYGTFKQGSNGKGYRDKLEQELNYVLDNRFAEYIASVAGSEANAMKMLERNNAKAYTAFWKDKTPKEKDELRQFVLKEIRFRNAGAEESERQFKSKLDDVKSMIKDGFEPDNASMQWLMNNMGSLRLDSPVRKEANALNTIVKINRDLNSMSLLDRETYEQNMRTNVTAENYDTYDFVKQANSKYRDNISKDFIGTMKKQDKYKGSVLDFSLPDSRFQPQVDERIKTADLFGRVNNVKPKYLDEGEIESFRAEYQKASTQDKQLIMGRIVKTFGSKAGVVFDQLSPKDPVMGHLGGLFVNQSNKETLDAVIKGQDIINSGIKYDVNRLTEASAIRNVIGDAFYDVPKIQTAVIETAKALYAEEAVRKNYAKFNGSAFEEALQKAAGQKSGSDGKLYGGIIKHNGVKVSIPSSIPTKEFDDVMDKATLADFRYASDNFAMRKNTNGLFDDNNLEYTSDKLKEAVLIPIDSNRAKLRIGNSLLTLKGGYDLVINLDVLYRKLKDEKRL
jgi:hypothetical protein